MESAGRGYVSYHIRNRYYLHENRQIRRLLWYK
jgi:hypothetical protein